MGARSRSRCFAHPNDDLGGRASLTAPSPVGPALAEPHANVPGDLVVELAAEQEIPANLAAMPHLGYDGWNGSWCLDRAHPNRSAGGNILVHEEGEPSR